MLYAVVLAGGRSSRMGRDKAGLVMDGHSLLERAIKLLKDAGAEQILVSGTFPQYPCVPDLLPEAGPLGGLYSTLDAINRHDSHQDASEGTPLLVIPVDMPLLTVDALTRLLEHPVPGKAVHYAGEVFPLLLFANTALRNTLHEQLASQKPNARSMRWLLDYLDAEPITPAELPSGIFTNINDHTDWATIQARGS